MHFDTSTEKASNSQASSSAERMQPNFACSANRDQCAGDISLPWTAWSSLHTYHKTYKQILASRYSSKILLAVVNHDNGWSWSLKTTTLSILRLKSRCLFGKRSNYDTASKPSLYRQGKEGLTAREDTKSNTARLSSGATCFPALETCCTHPQRAGKFCWNAAALCQRRSRLAGSQVDKEGCLQHAACLSTTDSSSSRLSLHVT